MYVGIIRKLKSQARFNRGGLMKTNIDTYRLVKRNSFLSKSQVI